MINQGHMSIHPSTLDCNNIIAGSPGHPTVREILVYWAAVSIAEALILEPRLHSAHQGVQAHTPA